VPQVLGLVEAAIKRHVPEVAGLPVIGMSALTGSGAEALMPAVLAAHQLWTQRVPTARLNGCLAKVRPEDGLLSS
jgi:GTP-binding protein